MAVGHAGSCWAGLSQPRLGQAAPGLLGQAEGQVGPGLAWSGRAGPALAGLGQAGRAKAYSEIQLHAA